MTLAEFKAWLEGYACSFADGTPNAEQWAEVQRKLQKVTPLDLSQPVQPFGPNYYPPQIVWTKPSSPLDPVPYWQQPVVTC